MNTVSDQAVAHVLRGAAIALGWRGWTQGENENDEGMCLGGAILFVITGDATMPAATLSGGIGRGLTPDERALEWAAWRAVRRVLGVDDPEAWNDCHTRTISEVQTALHAAAALAASGPAGRTPVGAL